MATVTLERPGVRVFQEFSEAAPTPLRPLIPAVIIGESWQLITDATAGLFDNILQVYNYPGILAGVVVDTNETVVKLVTTTGADLTGVGDTFDITNDGAVTITASTVTVGADPNPQKIIKANTQFSPAAGLSLIDILQDFFTLAVRLGDVVVFEDTSAGLLTNTSKQSDNLGNWTITGIIGSDTLSVLGLTPGHVNGTVNEPFQITTGSNDHFLVDVDALGDVGVVLSPATAATAQDIADDLNGDSDFAAVAVADAFNRKVRIRSRTTGTGSSVTISADSLTANTVLGFTAAQTDSGSISDSLKAETDVEYRIVRNGALTGTIKISFSARRTDEAAKLYEFADTETLEASLGKIHPDNPLAYGMALALAATGDRTTVLGVIVANKDTTVSHGKALEFLESKDIYSMVPLSQNTAVLALYPIHVTNLSEPTSKHERIAWICPLISEFDEKQASRVATTPVGALPTSRFTDAGATYQANGVVVGDVLKVSAVTGTLEIDSVDQSALLLSQGFVELQVATVVSETEVDIVGEFTTTSPGDVTYSVKTMDYTFSQKASNQAGGAVGFTNRRLRYVSPDVGTFSVAGVDTELPGYYTACVSAAMTSELPPSQGHTNLPVPGPVELRSSNDVFTELQMDIMAGGGVWLYVQDTPGGPITTRHQLTTDISDINKREHSIVTAVDYGAKRIRAQISPLIGRFNLTNDYLTKQLRPALAGAIRDLVEERIWGRATVIRSLKIVENQPDTAEAIIQVAKLTPANYVNVRLII